MGEDVARAGLAGRDRLPDRGRPAAVARGARLPPRRLRLHDLHRQLGPAARRRSPRRSTTATSSSRRCSPATATSKAASTRWCARTTSRRRRWWSPTRSPARWTSTSQNEPLGDDRDGKPVYLRDIWPTQRARSARRCARASSPSSSSSEYGTCSTATRRGSSCTVPDGADVRVGRRRRPTCASRRSSTTSSTTPTPRRRHRRRARAGAARRLGHHRPHLAGGNIAKTARRRAYLDRARRASREDFNSYGARRGNHEVMMRGTFANIRLRNLLLPGVEGGCRPRHLPPTASRCRSTTRR